MPFSDGVATPDEIKDFCNQVREAGGADILDELLPGVRMLSHSCLIAKNLNFDCEVDGSTRHGWHMSMQDYSLAEKIADALDLELVTETLEEKAIIKLPKAIGLAAHEFDNNDSRFSEFVVALGE